MFIYSTYKSSTCSSILPTDVRVMGGGFVGRMAEHVEDL
jgi:hypothetical protein